MMDLLDGEKILMIYLLVLTQFTNVTDTQTPHDGIGRAYANYAMDTERHATADLVIYRVAHKKRPKLCSDVVLVNNRIQTKGNNILSAIVDKQYEKL